jgi:hypothetical protein
MFTCCGCTWALALHAFLGVCANAQILWREPQPTTTSDWIWGPGGQEMAPHPPFQFLKERLGGTNPKVEVRDAAGRRWVVKFGSEIHSDTFAPRLLNALGYAAEPTFFVQSGSINDTHGLKRAKHFISKDGSFRDARFKLHNQEAEAGSDNGAWSWVANPFTGSLQLGGLKILSMLASNWDTKDARDGEGESNTGIVRSASTPGSRAWYAVTDWGASFGKSGGYFGRDRWNWNGYRAQTSNFVRLTRDGNLEWGFKGKHGRDISTGVGLEDVRWILPYLSRITDDDLEAGLAASGASTAVARAFTQSIRARILQLQRIAESARLQQAAK